MGQIERIEAKLDDLLVKVNILMEKEKRRKIIYIDEITDLLNVSKSTIYHSWEEMQKRGCPIGKDDQGRISAFEDELIAYLNRGGIKRISL